MSMEILEQQREEMLREAELTRMKKTLRADHRRPATSQEASTVAWKLERVAGLLRKFFQIPKNAD